MWTDKNQQHRNFRPWVESSGKETEMTKKLPSEQTREEAEREALESEEENRAADLEAAGLFNLQLVIMDARDRGCSEAEIQAMVAKAQPPANEN